MTCLLRHVKTYAVLIIHVSLLTACATQPSSDPQHIGIVTTWHGLPSVTRNGKVYLLATQSRIYPGDIVKNDGTSQVSIHMIDDTQIILGRETHFVFHEYDFEPGSFFPTARMTFTSGRIRARTENVTRAWFGQFEIQTPLATIRPETVDFWAEVTRDNRLEVVMLEGKQVQVGNDHGAVQIKRQQFGTSVRAGSAPKAPKSWSERALDSIRSSTAPRGPGQ